MTGNCCRNTASPDATERGTKNVHAAALPLSAPSLAGAISLTLSLPNQSTLNARNTMDTQITPEPATSNETTTTPFANLPSPGESLNRNGKIARLPRDIREVLISKLAGPPIAPPRRTHSANNRTPLHQIEPN